MAAYSEMERISMDHKAKESNTSYEPMEMANHVDDHHVCDQYHSSPRPSSDGSATLFGDDDYLIATKFYDTDPNQRTRPHRRLSIDSPLRQKIWSSLQAAYITNYGAILVLISQIFGALMNLSTRVLETPGSHGDAMHPFQILFARQSITAACCTGYALYTRSIPHFPLGPPEVRGLLVFRGVSGFFGVFGLYFCLKYLPLAEATVLTFLAPILTCYLCSFLIPGETFTRQQQFAGYLSLVGVVFIAQPVTIIRSFTIRDEPSLVLGMMNSTIIEPTISASNSTLSLTEIPKATPEQHLTAIGIAMIGVLGATCAVTSIRKIGTRAHPFVSVNYFSVWSTIVSLIALIVAPDVKFRLPGNFMEWALLINLGICGFIMQCMLTAGLAYSGPASSVDAEKIRSVDEEHGYALKIYNERSPSLEVTASRSTLLDKEHNSDQDSSRHHEHTPDKITTPPKRISGNRATSMMFTQMLFALVIDKFVFGISPDAVSWLGSGLILSGSIWVAAAKDSTPKKSHVSDEDRIESSLRDSEEAIGLMSSSTQRDNDIELEDRTRESKEGRAFEFAEDENRRVSVR